MRSETLEVNTGGRVVTDITDVVERFAEAGEESGLLHAFLPHATAGLAIIETGAGSEGDLEAAIDRLLPRDERYAHRHGSTGHGADHLLPALIPPSLVLPVEAGKVVLGTWQRVVIVDTNRENNRRTLRLSLVEG